MRKELFRLLFLFFTLMILVVSCIQSPDVESMLPILTSTPTFTGTPSPIPTATYLPITPVHSGTEIPSSKSVISTENIDRLTLFAYWGNGNISDAQYTPNGQYLVVTSSIGIYFYSAKDFSLVKYIDLAAAISHIAITKDGQKIAVASLDNVLIFNEGENKPSATINETASASAFSPDGQVLALGTYNWPAGSGIRPEGIKLFDSSTAKMILEFKDSDWAQTIAFSPDGRRIAAGGYSTQMWNLNGELLDTHGVYVSGGSTRSLSFSPDGKLLAEAADTNNILHVWRVLDNGNLVIFRTIALSNYPIIFEVAISPDGKRLAAATSNGLLIWQLDSGKLIFPKNENNIDNHIRYYEVAWSTDSNNLTALSEQSGLEIWDVNKKELSHSLNYLTGSITSTAWQPNGGMIASATNNGTIFLLDSQNGNIVNTFIGDSIRSNFAFSPNEVWLAIKSSPFSQEGGVVITKLTDKTFRQVLTGSYGDGLSNQSFSRDGKYLVTSGFENGKRIVQVWNTTDWSLQNSWRVGDELVGQLIFCPDGETIALVESRDSKIKFYKITDGELTMNIELTAPVGNPRVNALAFSPDGQKLLTSSRECETTNDCRKVLRLWRIGTGNLVYTIKDIQGRQTLPPSPPYYSDISSLIAWSPNGELFAAGFSDGTVGVFGANDGKLLQSLSGHTMMVMGVLFSPDGEMIASASLDGTIRLWKIK